MIAETETTVVEEPIKKTSKLKRIGTTAAVAGFYGITGATMVASAYYSYKIITMNLETAKLQLEAAKDAVQQ